MFNLPDLLQASRPYTVWLNRVSLCLGMLVGIGYQCLAIPNANGFILGVFTSVANAFIMWIINDHALAARTMSQQSMTTPRNQAAFGIASILACLLSALSVWTHTYYSIILLAPFLPIPIWTLTLLSHGCALSFGLAALLFSTLQLHRRWQSLSATENTTSTDSTQIDSQLSRIQLFTRYVSDINNILHAIIAVAHIWATDAQISSLVFGVVLVLCDVVVIHIYNQQLLQEYSEPARSNVQPWLSAHSFVALSSLCIVGSKVGSFLVYYQGISVLSLALGFWPLAATVMALTVASITTLAGLLFAATQAHERYTMLYHQDTVEQPTAASTLAFSF